MGIGLLLFSWIKRLLNANPVFAVGLWPKWRIKLCITEPLTACAGAVTGPWEIHRDCLQHMSYIIASICTPTTTCKLQMCTSPVISVQTEEGKRGWGLWAGNQIALHCLFCLGCIVWITSKMETLKNRSTQVWFYHQNDAVELHDAC